MKVVWNETNCAHIVPMHCHDGVRFTGLDHPETVTTLCAPLHDGLQNRGEGATPQHSHALPVPSYIQVSGWTSA